MSQQICLCGAFAGYPHKVDCPRPEFRYTDERAEQWEREREALRCCCPACIDPVGRGPCYRTRGGEVTP